MKRTLGTCYYPEHWPREIWEEDAQRMAELGLTWVRIGEFSWSKIEPKAGEYCFEWLDEAIDVLGRAGLKVVLGTPTATPPRWMIDKYPDMLAVDVEGRIRKFGSRRHYCFSHEGYKQECAVITKVIAERYGKNPHVAAWQTDNEYGCHDTTISYGSSALQAFRLWLQEKYKTIDALNDAWGNIFWSMIYDDFDQIELPNLTVTEPNPAHSLDFRRFSSDQVVRFNRLQCDIIREYSAAPLSHNYMGRITDFDHFEVGKDLEIATWDSYPLGFLEDRVGTTPERQRAFARQGDPDFQAFHHDLYRAVGHGRWWVMEQQPGPVNWAPTNPAPLEGMVRLWTWEAFAHGAEAVCYFRWRQAPFAQEQMHAGLLRPDHKEAPAFAEAREVFKEIQNAPVVAQAQSRVGLIFDYDADFAWAVQPHGDGLSYFGIVFDCYRALRSLGLSIDILPPDTQDFSGYDMILAPALMHMSDALKAKLSQTQAQIILGPRAGARDAHMTIPVPLPPAFPDLDVTVSYVESIRSDMPIALEKEGVVEFYREHLEGQDEIVLATEAGEAVAMGNHNIVYLGACLDLEGWKSIISPRCELAGIETMELPDGIRRRACGDECFWFNYTTENYQMDDMTIPPAGVIRVVGEVSK